MNDVPVSRDEFAGFKSELKGELGEIKNVMTRMAEAMTRLAIIDERQQGQADTNREILKRLEGIEGRQHAADVQAAKTGDTGARIGQLETAVREMVVERAQDKARQDGMVKTVRWLWAALPIVAAVMAILVSSGIKIPGVTA